MKVEWNNKKSLTGQKGLEMMFNIYDLIIGNQYEREDGSTFTVYCNEFYALEVDQNHDGIITDVDVLIIDNKRPSLPTITVEYTDQWRSNIQYKGVKMSIDSPYKEISQEFISSSQIGQITARLIEEKLNLLEEIMVIEMQNREYMEAWRESILEDIINPIEGEDCSHWSDKVWLPKRHYV